MENYRIHDLTQAVLGAFTGILGMILFFIFGTYEKNVIISPIVGIIFTLILLVISYQGLVKLLPSPRDKIIIHLIADYIVSLGVAILISYLFGVFTFKSLTILSFFGTIPVVISWVIVIPAIVFDIKDINSFIGRWMYFGSNDNISKERTPNAIRTWCNMHYNTKEEIEKCIKG